MPLRLVPLALFAALASLALATAPARGQSVRLQLFDHVVGSEVLHNTALPAGTEVFVVAREETRAVRLRNGYGGVTAALSGARRDRVGEGGFTEGTYAPTARGRRAYFVAARLPDGRLFQSYVKTADAGWQPGFDAVTGGRVSMGEAPARARASLAPALAALSARVAPADGAGDSSRLRPPAAPTDTAGTAPLEPAFLPPVADSVLRAESRAAATPVELEPAGPLPPGAEGLGEPAPARPWPWALGGALSGAALTAAALLALARRERRRLHAHYTRLLPDPDERARAEAAWRTEAEAERRAEAARHARTAQQIEVLQHTLLARDAEIVALREDLDARDGDDEPG